MKIPKNFVEKLAYINELPLEEKQKFLDKLPKRLKLKFFIKYADNSQLKDLYIDYMRHGMKQELKLLELGLKRAHKWKLIEKLIYH